MTAKADRLAHQTGVYHYVIETRGMKRVICCNEWDDINKNYGNKKPVILHIASPDRVLA